MVRLLKAELHMQILVMKRIVSLSISTLMFLSTKAINHLKAKTCLAAFVIYHAHIGYLAIKKSLYN